MFSYYIVLIVVLLNITNRFSLKKEIGTNEKTTFINKDWFIKKFFIIKRFLEVTNTLQ